MPVEINIPFDHDLEDHERESIINSAVTKNGESQSPISIQLVFQGISVNEQTDVVAQIQQPVFTLVKSLRSEIAMWCSAQQQQQSSSSSSISPSIIKLNFVGVTLTDEKERVSHAVKRVLKNRHLQNPKLLKIFVSLDQNSKLAAQANQHDFVVSNNNNQTGGLLSSSSSSANGTSGGGVRRDRNSSGGAGGEMNLSPEQADAMANMMASNPQFIDMMLNSDPTMREMMRTNPDLARQMRDPDTLRAMFRGQASREGRVMQDNEQRAALAFVQNHPEGHALIERALGREGILTENGEGSMFSVTNGRNSIADEVSNSSTTTNNNSDNRPLLPTANGMMMGQQQQNNNNNPFASLMGGGSNLQQNNLFASFMTNNNNNVTTATAASTATHNQQGNNNKQEKIDDLVKNLTEEMGFEKEISELAATEAEGDLEKALALLEEWQN